MSALALGLLLAAAPACSGSAPAGCPAACAAGALDACRSLAELVANRVLPASALPPAFPVVQKACDEKSPPSCTPLAVWTDFGGGTKADPATAVRLLTSACEAKDAAACAFLSRHYAAGQGVAKDAARAATLLEAACAAGNLFACAGRGEALQRDPEQKKRGEGAALLQKACEGGDSTGCALLSIAYAQGLGVVPDPVMSSAWAKRSCDAENPTGCMLLADAYYHARPPAPHLARPLFEKACAAQLGLACHELAVFYARGLGGKAEPAKAVEALGHACDYGGDRGESCGFYAQALLKGDAVKRDAAKGAQTAKRSCDQGYPPGCTLWAHQLATGEGVKKDLGEAKRVLQAGCNAGDQDACRAVLELAK